MKMRFVSSGVVAGLMLASSANAAVIEGEVTEGPEDSIFEKVVPTADAPITVGQDNQQSPNLFALDEKQNITLMKDVAGLTAGTVVNSHYVWFDPAGRSLVDVAGSVTFANRILAVITARDELNATDDLGNPNVTYTSVNLRGLEGGDSATFTGNTLTVNLAASTPGDYMRVLTAVPEPSTWMMLILGFGLIGAALRTEKLRHRTRVAVR